MPESGCWFCSQLHFPADARPGKTQWWQVVGALLLRSKTGLSQKWKYLWLWAGPALAVMGFGEWTCRWQNRWDGIGVISKGGKSLRVGAGFLHLNFSYGRNYFWLTFTGRTSLPMPKLFLSQFQHKWESLVMKKDSEDILPHAIIFGKWELKVGSFYFSIASKFSAVSTYSVVIWKKILKRK